MTTTFDVLGQPAPQGSKRHVGGGRMIEMSKKVGPWRDDVRNAALLWSARYLVGPVAIDLEFRLPHPKSAPKRDRGQPHSKRPDLDKLIRSTLDGLTGVIFTDDSQVADITAQKRTCREDELPGATITITPLTG